MSQLNRSRCRDLAFSSVHFFVADEFPSPEDWDNEEYTGSLADTKVFTPSTAVEPESSDAPAAIETEIKDESLQIHLSIQPTQNVFIFFAICYCSLRKIERCIISVVLFC